MEPVKGVIKRLTRKKLNSIEGTVIFSESQQNDRDESTLYLRIDSEPCDIFLFEQDKLPANLRVGDRVRCYFGGAPVSNIDLKAYEILEGDKVLTRGIKKGYHFV